MRFKLFALLAASGGSLLTESHGSLVEVRRGEGRLPQILQSHRRLVKVLRVELKRLLLLRYVVHGPIFFFNR